MRGVLEKYQRGHGQQAEGEEREEQGGQATEPAPDEPAVSEPRGERLQDSEQHVRLEVEARLAQGWAYGDNDVGVEDVDDDGAR